MLRLGHAHGTLLSLMNIAFAAGLARMNLDGAVRQLVSRCLTAATLLVLGGIVTHGAEPGLGIILLPVGALFKLSRCVR